MRPWVLGISRGLLVVVGLGLSMACGGGGSSSSSSASLPQSSLPPVVALVGWSPNDARLSQYTSYTFTATATDPNIGGSIVSFTWDFGDGTTKTTPSSVINGVATGTCAHAFTAAGTPTLTVTATNAAKVTSAAVTRSLTVNAAASPLTVTFTAPAAALTISPAIGSSTTVTFTVNVANTGTGSLAASGFHLDPGDSKATVGAPTDLGNGNWSIPVAYQADTAIGQRTATPALTVTDSNGVSSAPVTGPVITIRTVSTVDNAPVITMTATPKIPAGSNATWQGVPIDFAATATDPDHDPLTYSWTFGDAGNAGDIARTQDSAALHQTHTYNAPGIYKVVFTADDGRGVPNVSVKTITLNLNILANAAPTLSVAYPSGSLYANVPLTFTATTTDANGDAVALTWDFGDGTPKVIGTNSVIHSFAAAGSDLVTVTADDGKGGVTTWTATLDILTNRPPVAKVTSASVNLYQNKSYTFTASATDPDAGDTIDHYVWNFGDNTAVQTSAGGPTTSVTHTYASTFTGTANVTVQAVDSHGSTGDWAPAVPFTVLATQLPKGAFVNPAGAATYNTELGATGVSLPYIVSMTNPNGTGYLPISALTFTTGDATATVQSATANGDGTYTYVVLYKPATTVGTRLVTPTVVATDAQGITGLVASGGPVTINTQAANNPPVIAFTSTSTPSAGTNSSWQGVAFTFNGTATDPDKDPMTYTITFGDTGGAGDIATTPVPASGAISATHTYAAPGIYTAKLTVSDGRTNGTKTITLNMNILANTAPVVSFTNTPAGTTPYANVPITFTGTVTDANGDPTTITWDFGDGTAKVTGTNPVTHSFAAAGTTVVKLTADDGKGGVTTATQTYTIQANLPPVAKVTTATGSLYQNKSYTFTASATDPNAGDTIDHYVWNFGDNTAVQTSAGGPTTSVTHTYASTFTGTANVTVQAVDSHGSTGDWAPAVPFTVVATPLPVVAFTSPAATTLNAELNGTVSQVFTLTATNPRAGQPGVTDPIPVGDITFNPNDSNAAVTNAVSNGGGSYSFTVTYTGAATAGTRTSTPTAYATDTVGIQGLPATGPLMTITTKGVNHAPTITITTPATDNTIAYTSKPFTLGFTLNDADNDPVVYTVNWGDGTTTSTGSPTGDFVAGVPVTTSHTYSDAFTSTSQGVSITITATDNRSANSNAVPQTRLVTVTFNALPTATISSPQDSGTAPTGLQPGINPPYVVIPLNGKLTFAATHTLPGSQDAVITTWSFPGGVPSSASGDTPGDVVFAGTAGVITPVTVTYTVTDPFGRTATATKLVLVDGINTQQFNLSFQYRLKSDNNTTTSLTPVTTSANGLGAAVRIFQDGLSNTYNVQNQAQLSGAQAAVSIPVRSDLPFYIEIPGFGNDATSYLMRIPNAPTGSYQDPSLTASAPVGSSTFSFTNATAPWNPTLQVVTAQGFAPESLSAPERRLDGYTDLVLGQTPVNVRWLDRLSVPANDPTGAIQWTQSSNTVAQLSGIPAYQLFPEWPTLLLTRGTADLSLGTDPLKESVPDLTTTPGGPSDLGFVLDYTKYTGDTQPSETFAAFSMQTFRVPAGSTDPYHLSPAWQNASCEMSSTTATAAHQALNPTVVSGTVPTFLNNLVNSAPGLTPLAGGIDSLPLPYDPNDPNRTPLLTPTTRGYSGIRQVFSYSEYLWSTVWARPLVLNSARPRYNEDLANFSHFRYSNPAAWPKASGISPDNSAFDLTVHGGGVFDGSAPVGLNGAAAPATGVGRFFWTAFTPSYTGDANPGAAIERTWLADDTTQQIPTAFPAASTTGDATDALGFMTPQDTIVDKRGRNADGTLNGQALGGYRVTWYNPTKDASGNPVAPDFWVVELKDATGVKHFMLPASYPAGTQGVSDQILTDARTYLPSGNLPAAGPATDPLHPTVVTDTVAPGYCWFDVPVELRPTSGATLTVFAVKSILKNNPVAAARPLNRPDWIDAAKTATATMTMLTSSGADLTYAYKIPFNYDWDIVLASGPQTPVAP